jgi:hypothetical protein
MERYSMRTQKGLMAAILVGGVLLMMACNRSTPVDNKEIIVEGIQA